MVQSPCASLVVGIVMNRGKRNACLFLGIIALAVILSFGWSNWLLLLPAALGIGAFLYQMNILIVSSELRRRSKEPEQSAEPEETETLRKLTPKEIEERKRRFEFMKSHRGMITKRAAEYMSEHPDELPDDVVDIVTEKCFLEHEIARMEAEIAEAQAEAESQVARHSKDVRPLGTLTYDEASFYFTKYCELMQEQVGFQEKESRLPTSVERMKEALKVECLNWCNHGKDFDESCQFIATGYAMLARFLPDELAEKASLERAVSDDLDVLREYREAATAAGGFSEHRINDLNTEWNEFQEKYRAKYDS